MGDYERSASQMAKESPSAKRSVSMLVAVPPDRPVGSRWSRTGFSTFCPSLGLGESWRADVVGGERLAGDRVHHGSCFAGVDECAVQGKETSVG